MVDGWGMGVGDTGRIFAKCYFLDPTLEGLNLFNEQIKGVGQVDTGIIWRGQL